MTGVATVGVNAPRWGTLAVLMLLLGATAVRAQVPRGAAVEGSVFDPDDIAPIKSANAETSMILGLCVGISDGDTLMVRSLDGSGHIVQLAGIDAPDLSQDPDEAEKSQKVLESIAYRKRIILYQVGENTRGQTIAWASVENTPVNYMMVRRGYAWHAKAHDQSSVLAQAQKAAKKEQRGMWEKREVTAPWVWRAEEKAKRMPPENHVNVLGMKVPMRGMMGGRTKAPPRPPEGVAPTPTPKPKTVYWHDLATGYRHTKACRHYGKTAYGEQTTREDLDMCPECLLRQVR